MFDFQKLEVYKKAKLFNQETARLIQENKFDRIYTRTIILHWQISLFFHVRQSTLM